MEKKIRWKPYIIASIISIIIGGGIFLIFFLTRKTIYWAIDGTSYAAVALISVAGLIWVAREGFFDIFSYGFRQLATTMFNKKANGYNDFRAYKEYKVETREKRSKYFISVAIVGCLFLIATIILHIIYKL